MATITGPCIINSETLPDVNGNTYFEPMGVVFGSNDRHNRQILAFTSQSARQGIAGAFVVPQNYIGTPKIVGKWMTTATTGDVVFDIDIMPVADAETLDPAADTETATVTETAKATARQANDFEIALTAGNFAAGDIVPFNFVRDAADAADTLAATAWVEPESLRFQYTDI